MSFDNLLGRMFPAWALNRAKARAMTRLYEAAQPSQYHRPVRGGGLSGDAVMQATGARLRDRTRHLDENSDIAVGILNVLVDNIIGTGITVEPMARTSTGKLHKPTNERLRELWVDFWQRPDTTGECPGTEVERLLCRSWLRDGEVFTRHHDGPLPDGSIHLHAVPYSLELIEADYLPFDRLSNPTANVIQGVEKNTIGRPIAYHFLTSHPGNTNIGVPPRLDTVRVPAEFVTHLKTIRRIRQTRGVPILHSVIQRLSDVHEYETSERIAARVASDFTGYIKRSAQFDYPIDTDTNGRQMNMQAGMIWDNLLPGEEIATIGTDRPNSGMNEFINGQLKRAAAGAGTSYSSISKNYDGTYSAQRQEMIETRPSYTRLSAYFIAQQMLPIWNRFVLTCETAGLLRVPQTVNRQSLLLPQMRGPGMAWIDQLKETQGDTLAVESGFKSRYQVIREHGGDPEQVDSEREQDTFVPAASQPPAAEEPPEPDEDTASTAVESTTEAA